MPTLLLCDDNTIVQRMIAMTFAAENITVTAVSDGEQAIDRITREHPDIVLAGTTTPKRSGYEVSAFVKSFPELASIPVLLLAGAFEPIDDVRAAQVRCDGVLIKPLEPQQLVARVKELIAGPSATARAAGAGAPRRVERPAGGGPAAAPSTDDYFEQLDAALTQRSAPVTPSRSPDSGVVPTLDSVLAPASSPSAPANAAPAREAAVTDALVDEVTRRVIERLGARGLKDVVTEVVADVAERLIREEIARIRSK